MSLLSSLRLRAPSPYKLPALTKFETQSYVTPPELTLPRPRTAGVDSYDSWVTSRAGSVTPAYWVKVPKGYATVLGQNLDGGGRLIREATHKLRQLTDQRWTVNNAALRTCIGRQGIPEFDGPVAALTASNDYQYFHWFLDVLPRIHLLKDVGAADCRFYISGAHKFQRESLAILKLDEIVRSDQQQIIRARELRIPCHQIVAGRAIPNWSIEFLRRAFVEAVVTRPSRPTRRLFLSRAKTGRRRMTNEDELMEALEPLGFERVFPEGLSLREQINLFHEAEIVTGPVGGAFTNVIFCQAGTKVIGLSYRIVHDFLYRLATACNHDYFYVASREEQPGNRLTLDYRIERSDLTATLKLAGVL